MSGAEQAVRAYVAQLLRDDAAVMAVAHGVYETAAPRMTPPYVRMDGVEGREWGMKDRGGREAALTISVIGKAVMVGAAVAAVEAALQDVRGQADGWDVVASNVLRSGWREKADGSGQHQWVLRCRCLKALD